MKKFVFLYLLLFSSASFASLSEVSNLLCRNLQDDISKEEYVKFFSAYFREEVDFSSSSETFKNLREKYGKCKKVSESRVGDGHYLITTVSDDFIVNFNLYLDKENQITGLWVRDSRSVLGKIEEKIRYVCSLLKKNASLNYSDNFDSSFIEAIPKDQIEGILKSIVTEFGECQETVNTLNSPFSASFIVKAKKELKFNIVISQKNNLITGLLFKGEVSPPVVIESDKQLKEIFDSLEGNSNLLFSTLEGKEIVSVNKDQAFPLGSAFKLYILLALEEKISRGEAKWSDLLKIEKKFKSLPSGEMQNLKEGEKRELFFFARKMIEISDNTATDHLLNFVGRESVEKIVKRLGNKDSRNIPFLSTMDMFKARAFFDDKDVAKYMKSSREVRLNMISDLYKKSDEEFNENIKKWGNTPTHIQKIEWFANAGDLCQLYQELDLKKSSKVLDILSFNTPFVSKKLVKYAGYKGGSEPGVISMAYLLKKENKNYCFIAAQNDEDRAIQQDKFFSIVKGSLDYLLNKK
ncbi:putative exported protein [Halobacteriovorax marinus SJ]|uniref:Exported protein n=1 Tax=Halobacteriovorax marinus (strain ATCC BAA-682 / DSM 15412 / SJ) TaxID=862908 RepID=E1WZE8_HALMS|nr:serine hydrolase [Halobacteriovorax marinus]CBW27836.1 putative exported protein [Halobacteriovorax marinus SJ]